MSTYSGNCNSALNVNATVVLKDWVETNFDKEFYNLYNYKSYSNPCSIDKAQRLKHLYETDYLFL